MVAPWQQWRLTANTIHMFDRFKLLVRNRLRLHPLSRVFSDRSVLLDGKITPNPRPTRVRFSFCFDHCHFRCAATAAGKSFDRHLLLRGKTTRVCSSHASLPLIITDALEWVLLGKSGGAWCWCDAHTLVGAQPLSITSNTVVRISIALEAADWKTGIIRSLNQKLGTNAQWFQRTDNLCNGRSGQSVSNLMD